jgi:adenine-specific DNA-methyltransferase
MTNGNEPAKKPRLELTWIGKDTRPKLEPRILLPVPEHSHRVDGDGIHDNLLIHGDNLLALKSLEQDYAGKVKCVYIDPPYNTGQAFEHYDDAVEHSLWLTLIRERLHIIRNLMRDDGVLFMQLNDDEAAYAKVCNCSPLGSGGLE